MQVLNSSQYKFLTSKSTNQLLIGVLVFGLFACSANPTNKEQSYANADNTHYPLTVSSVIFDTNTKLSDKDLAINSILTYPQIKKHRVNIQYYSNDALSDVKSLQELFHQHKIYNISVKYTPNNIKKSEVELTILKD